MQSKTMTRVELAERFSKQFFIPQRKANFLVEVVIEELVRSLRKASHLKISSFGTFTIHNKSERMGRNPKTGKDAVITARKSLSFRPSALLKKKVNRKPEMGIF